MGHTGDTMRHGKKTRQATSSLRCGLMALVLAVTACGVANDVVSERADQIDGPARPETAPVFSDDVVEVEVGDVATVPSGTIAWTGCDDFGIPSAEFLDSGRWECARLAVPMDPLGGREDLAPVELALTRHAATGERRGALLMNPGGPGGSGLEVVWGLRGSLPATMLRAFDIVSWDPRGVGQSTPAITCGADPDPDSSTLMKDCAVATGELASFLAAPYSAADMEAIRRALGESELNYLGYSYGSALGAIYAARFPDTVGRFVLDGVTDPLIGSADGYFEDGFPYYAHDGVPAATARLEELCDLTDRCDLGSDSAARLDELRVTVDELPTLDYDFDPDTVDNAAFGELILSSLGYVGDWELLGTALSDAANGDASALAALTSGGVDGDTDETLDGETSFELANLVIYCADFAHVIVEWDYCDGLPRNEFPMEPVVGVDVAEPILVIGTTFDPSTPGEHAPDFAAALDDAVHMIWDGVGHTAFPAPTPCVNDAVSDYFLVGTLPLDGMICSFLAGVTDDAEVADQLFGHDGVESERLLVDAIDARGGTDTGVTACIARALNQLDDRVISHVVLGVTSEAAEAAVTRATAAC